METFSNINNETKEKGHFLLSVFCFAPGSEETLVQTAEMTGHGVGISYETGSCINLYMERWLATDFHLVLCTFLHCLQWKLGKAVTVGKTMHCERNFLYSFAFSVRYHNQTQVSNQVMKSHVTNSRANRSYT